MKKSDLILALVLSVATTLSFAGAKGQDWNDSTGIVTPDVATGMYRTDRFASSSNGELVICRSQFEHRYSKSSCTDETGKNAWSRVQEAIPVGKTFVGFKSVSGSHGAHNIEVYWK